MRLSEGDRVAMLPGSNVVGTVTWVDGIWVEVTWPGNARGRHRADGLYRV